MSKIGKLYFGVKGESLFTEPFVDLTETDEWNKELPEFFKRMSSKEGDRAYVVLAALVVEYHIDKLLLQWIPGYKRLSENRDFTLSIKIELLRALKLIPNHIVNLADCIRKIRNVFAHDIQIDELDKLKKGKVIKECRSAVNEFLKEKEEVTIRQLFEKASSYAITGLRTYQVNIKLLRKKLESEVFLEDLNNESRKRLATQIKEIFKT